MKITNLEKIAATGELNNQFVGVKIANNKIEFHYPETYQLSDSDDELRRDILSVLRTIGPNVKKAGGFTPPAFPYCLAFFTALEIPLIGRYRLT